MSRRTFVGALVAVAILASSIIPAYANTRWDKCKFQTLEAGFWTVHEVKLTIKCAVLHWPVTSSNPLMTPLEYALHIAYRESRYQWDATNSSSGACGIFQHLPQYWPIRQNNFDIAYPKWRIAESCYDARANIVVAIWMVHNGGWGPWGG